MFYRHVLKTKLLLLKIMTIIIYQIKPGENREYFYSCCIRIFFGLINIKLISFANNLTSLAINPNLKIEYKNYIIIKCFWNTVHLIEFKIYTDKPLSFSSNFKLYEINNLGDKNA